MFKFAAERQDGGRCYGFGLSEANLNRMEFNKESIFFDFGYAGRPDLFALFMYLPEFPTPEAIQADVNGAKARSLPFFNQERGVTPETLRFFPIAVNIMQKFRETPFWGFDTHVEIADPKDMQVIFSGPDEESMRRYFVKAGVISPKAKGTYKGFGRQEGDRHGQ